MAAHDESMDDLSDTLGCRLAKTTARMNRILGMLFKVNGITVTPEQWSVLAAVMGDPGNAQARIAERGFKDKATVTRILDLLERDGLIQRRGDDKDRRAYRVYLSENGKRVVGKILPCIALLNRTMSRGFSSAEHRQFMSLLDRIGRNLSNLRP